MKLLFTSIALLVTFFGSSDLQEKELNQVSYFDGKWEVLVKDTPQGDATIPMRFETVDDKTMGYFIEDASGTESMMSSVTVAGDVLNAAFTISGYDVTLDLKKVDEDFSSGSLMGMFTAEAKRIK
ncbi:hypothetical protein J0A67_07780 [Algoriphagus aestuariicola]|uniref:Lipocalin-like domain-containing protein n=1 Tax=Algoriphagus aestuariicola TaxID=1852016 RepID=A0ABS3BNB1_9BACT|nr:hypothetical protein [Algoriphagus aestuariicola]MBN7800756.1 hypothetical protein [Algoriphagus aestuariicola]